jgi:hypothetical protein
VACGPASEALLHIGMKWGKGVGTYGSMFGPRVFFTGLTASLAMCRWGLKKIELI